MGQSRKLLVRTIVAGGAILIALLIGFAGWRAKRALRLSTEEVQAEREIRIETRPFARPAGARLGVVSAPALFLHAARFQDHLYLRGPGRPLEYAPHGTPPPPFSP